MAERSNSPCSLLKLPTELQIQILGTCSLEDALHLAAANRQLREVWMENESTIIDTMFRPEIEQFDEAQKVALLELRYSKRQDNSPLQVW